MDSFARLTEALRARLGVELPIVGGPMGGVAGPELVAAVSGAGGLGLLGHASVEPDEMRAQIRATRALTAKPFGVGLLFPSTDERPVEVPREAPAFLRELFGPGAAERPAQRRRYDRAAAEERLDVAIEAGVAVLACGLGTPEAVVRRAKAHGMTVISLVGSRHAALEVAARGADLIVAQGHEAGGHTGRVTTLVLVPQVADAVKVPVLAAGGIADGRGLAAALMLGACGALIGTRLLATPEARTAQAHKEAIVAMRDDGTVVSRCYTGKPARVLRNAFTDAWKGREAELLPMPQQWALIEPLVAPEKERGSLALANWPTGQAAVLVERIEPAGELVRRITAEAAVLVNGC